MWREESRILVRSCHILHRLTLNYCDMINSLFLTPCYQLLQMETREREEQSKSAYAAGDGTKS
jgi:hypothetical protein